MARTSFQADWRCQRCSPSDTKQWWCWCRCSDLLANYLFPRTPNSLTDWLRQDRVELLCSLISPPQSAVLTARREWWGHLEYFYLYWGLSADHCVQSPPCPQGVSVGMIVLYCHRLAVSLSYCRAVFPSSAQARCASYSTYRTCGLEFGQLE